MREDEIRRLVKIVEESSIEQLEISRWGKTVKISKSSPNSHGDPGSRANHTQPAITPAMASLAQPPKEIERATEAKPATANATEIKAPMVGTFYRAPSPEADPYVDVNHAVKKGQVLCIIEAMKLMNEIESEFSGTIVEVLVESGQPVEYNQPLFRIEES